MKKSEQTGFTLIEVLIALIVTTMLASLLFSALFFATRTQATISQKSTEMFLNATAKNRFAYVLSGCLPGSNNLRYRFVGSVNMVECYSTRSLSEKGTTTPTRVKWALIDAPFQVKRLVYSDELMIGSEGTEIAVLPSQVRFRFFGAASTPISSWPDTQDKRAWVPRRIEIANADSPDSGLWGISLGVSSWPEPDAPSLFGISVR